MMRLRLLYDSAQQGHPGEMLVHLSDQSIEYDSFDVRPANEISSLYGALAADAVNIIDPSVSSFKSSFLLGYAVGIGYPIIVIAAQARDLPSIEKSVVNAAVATPQTVNRVLTQLLAKMESQQSVPDDKVGLFAEIDPAEPVSIVCAEIPASIRPEYGQPNHRDFLRYATFADVDALIQLMVWFAASKHRTVHAYTSQQLPEDATNSHMLVVGGPSWNTLARSLYREIDLPIEHADGGPGNPDPIIDRATGEKWLPEMIASGDVVSDVGFVARAPSPYHPDRSVTIFGGILTHGVEAAVKVFTSPAVRTRNWNLVKPLLASPADGFCILFKARVFANNNIPPDLNQPGVILAAYSRTGGAFLRVHTS